MQLEINVSKYGLRSVRWGGNGEAFSEICGSETNSEFTSADYCGGFGIYIARTEATIRNARITFEATAASLPP